MFEKLEELKAIFTELVILPSAPEDYEPLNRTLTFNSMITRRMIPVKIVNDEIDEEDEQLFSRLQLEPVGGDLPNVQVDPAQAILIIVDDDSKKVIELRTNHRFLCVSSHEFAVCP